MIDVKEVADKADMILNGYAFTRSEGAVRVLNLNRPDRAAVLSDSGEMVETSMDDIELKIVRDYLQRNMKFMEE